MDIITWLTSIFGVLIGLAYFPEFFKILREKHAKEISLVTFGVLSVGMLVWFVYGITLVNWPIIISFGLSAIGTASVFFLALHYRKRETT